jgi:hypothetical protein
MRCQTDAIRAVLSCVKKTKGGHYRVWVDELATIILLSTQEFPVPNKA